MVHGMSRTMLSIDGDLPTNFFFFIRIIIIGDYYKIDPAELRQNNPLTNMQERDKSFDIGL